MMNLRDWDIHNEICSITRTALILNVSPATIKRWYKWAIKTGRTLEEVGLPQYVTDNRGTWYFTFDQVTQLQDFRKCLKWGAMAEFNSKYYWSKKKGDNSGK